MFRLRSPEKKIVLADGPTPIEHLELPHDFWIKRDDRVASLYGGNKVRKLEWLLAEAKAERKTRLLTLGAAGSHQVLATTLYGRREGFEVEAVLVQQPASEHAKKNLQTAIALGVKTTIAGSWAVAPAVVASRMGRDAYLVPLGGSSAIGSLGYVEAAKEIAAQVEAKEMPEPDVVVVAMGSGGTAAGLAVGFERAGLRTRVVGVAIAPPVAVVGVMARRVAKKTAELIGLPRAAVQRAVERLDVDRRWLGRGYGYSTSDGDRAMTIATPHGLQLDPTYTAKAFACALDLARSSTALFLHTLSSTAGSEVQTSELAPDLANLFRR